MQIFATPDDVAKPEWQFDKSYDENVAAEDEYLKRLAEWLRENGWTGKHTGREYREPIADGYARYMFAHAGPGMSSAVIHLDVGDGWHGNAIGHMSMKAVLAEIDRQEQLNAMFARKTEA